VPRRWPPLRRSSAQHYVVSALVLPHPHHFTAQRFAYRNTSRRATHAVRNSRHDRNSRHNHALPTMTTVHFRASD